jgi:hypothetical protein
VAQRLIARAWLGGADEPPGLGGFTLRPAQREVVGRVRGALREFGIALLADPPGAGKTVVALAVARGHHDVLVAAPATLRRQWERAAARAGVAIRFASLEALSRGSVPAAGSMLIVDEAHHARTPGTMRYRVLAALAARAATLLLTATPVVNRAADRSALLALGLAERAARLDPAEQARCILRSGETRGDLPRLRRLPPLAAPVTTDGIGAAIAGLPAPLSIAGGGDAIALIRMSLALAWSSSLGALDRALARRLQRGAAMADLLAAGRAPTREALHHWVLSDDATQLAFADLVAPAHHPRDPAVDARATLAAQRARLVAHLDAVSALRRLAHRDVGRDAQARADGIRTLATAHAGRRVVVFARHAETIRALWSALRHDPGVVAITGQRVHAAAGRWRRDEVLAALGPNGAAVDPRDPRAIRLLLTTDLLAEGVEMPGVGILVHADLPWTPARLAQRRGRIARPGGAAAEVLETRFTIPAEARAIVRLGLRLRRKRRAGRMAVRPADAPSRLMHLMRRWAKRPSRGRVATASAPREGFVAAVRTGTGILLLEGSSRPDRLGWRVTDDASRVLRACRSAGPEQAGGAAAAVLDARRQITRFLSERAARTLLGGTTMRASDAIARKAGRLEAALSGASPLDRSRVASDLQRLLGGQRGATSGAPASRSRLIAMLLLRPSAPRASGGPPGDARSSASPGTAAPR